jgi:hypothetical protein
MWGFSWLQRATARPDVTLAARMDAMEKSLREVQLMRLEWAEVLDKLTAWTNRQSARDAKYLKVGLQKITQDDPGTTIPAEGDPTTAPTKAELRSRLYARNGGTR